MDPFDLARMRRQLHRFVAACEDRSPLYAHLCGAAAQDDFVPSLMAAVPVASRRHPTLLLAAVHDRLLAETVGTPSPEGAALAAYYPSVGGDQGPDGAWPVFRRFCLTHADVLRTTLATRTTQTNEVGRSSLLLVALRHVQQDVGRPLAWLDVGASAGLNLLLDRYHHDVGGTAVGPADSPVQLRCDVSGPAPVGPAPPFAWRRGLDHFPVDVTDPLEARWLRACVWPEQVDRHARLRAAIGIANVSSPDLMAGDAVEDLAAAVADAPSAAHLVVTHTWTLAYLDHGGRRAFDATLSSLAALRPLTRIGFEGPSALRIRPPAEHPWTSVLLRTDLDGPARHDRVVAHADDHGRWLRWLDTPVAPQRVPATPTP